jgi:hypothetical protein
MTAQAKSQVQKRKKNTLVINILGDAKPFLDTLVLLSSATGKIRQRAIRLLRCPEKAFRIEQDYRLAGGTGELRVSFYPSKGLSKLAATAAGKRHAA